MAKKRKKTKRSARPAVSTPETRPAEAATVFWMTTLLATVLGEVGAATAWAIALASGEAPILRVLWGLLLVIAAITGLICLGFTPVVLRVRRVPPPKAITRFAVVVSVLPWLGLALAVVFQ